MQIYFFATCQGLVNEILRVYALCSMQSRNPPLLPRNFNGLNYVTTTSRLQAPLFIIFYSICHHQIDNRGDIHLISLTAPTVGCVQHWRNWRCHLSYTSISIEEEFYVFMFALDRYSFPA